MFKLRLSQINKQDIICGFLVSLIALPLSIGIAVASGVPPTAGILAAFAGGVLGAFFSGSRATINGPAAGLIVIVYAAVSELGGGDPMTGFRAVLACTVAAGLIQMVMGRLKLGTLGLAFPSSVVHGMLAAIGLIIISKQVHSVFGVTPSASSPLALFAELPHTIMSLNPGIAVIGLSSLLIMAVWNYLPKTFSRLLPAPLFAVGVGIALSLAMDLHHSHLVHGVLKDFSLGPAYLLTVPNNIKNAFFLPDFSQFSTFLFWKHTLLIAIVASAESTLSVCAVDKTDPLAARSDLNRNLFGNGIANCISGAMGGLPIIAEIVRSSANVSNGAKTQWSNFFHGIILFTFLVLAPGLLHEIPVAALAAVLIVVGFRLAAPKYFVAAFKHKEGLVFVTTVLTILMTDLLTGVFLGTMVELIKVFTQGKSWRLFGLESEIKVEEGDGYVSVAGPLAFTNYLQLRDHLQPQGTVQRLTLDLRKASVVDYTVNEHLSQHLQDFAALGKTLVIKRSNQEVVVH